MTSVIPTPMMTIAATWVRLTLSVWTLRKFGVNAALKAISASNVKKAVSVGPGRHDRGGAPTEEGGDTASPGSERTVLQRYGCGGVRNVMPGRENVHDSVFRQLSLRQLGDAFAVTQNDHTVTTLAQLL